MGRRGCHEGAHLASARLEGHKAIRVSTRTVRVAGVNMAPGNLAGPPQGFEGLLGIFDLFRVLGAMGASGL